MCVGGQRHAPATLPTGKRPGTYSVGGWVGPRSSLDGCEKSRPLSGFEHRIVETVASRCTDWAVPAYRGSGEKIRDV
jgi:hypothetical protein